MSNWVVGVTFVTFAIGNLEMHFEGAMKRVKDCEGFHRQLAEHGSGRWAGKGCQAS
jgi:hypothetical protein